LEFRNLWSPAGAGPALASAWPDWNPYCGAPFLRRIINAVMVEIMSDVKERGQKG